MKLLLLCPHFEPDLHAATGEVMTKLVHSLADRGHQIDVVTSLPWYRGHSVEPAWRGKPWRSERTDIGRVIRVWPFPVDKNNIPARAIGFGGFTSLATAAALTVSKPDIVMGMSPPVFLGDAAWTVARRWGVPFVFNVQDIFPDVAVDLGALNNERVIDLAKKHERSIYRRADAITVLSTDQQRNVQDKMPPDLRHRVHIIHNFADTERVQTIDRSDPHHNRDYRNRHGLGDKTVVMYSGNVGLSQSFDLVRAAADRYRNDAGVHFVINGEGAARPEVDAWARDFPNVTVSDFAPREALSETLGAADLHLILLKSGLAKSSTPSKMYGILAAGRPVLASIDENSEVSQTIAEARAGASVRPDDAEAFLAALEELLSDPARLVEMGSNAKSFVDSRYTPAAQAAAFEDLFESLMADASDAKAESLKAQSSKAQSSEAESSKAESSKATALKAQWRRAKRAVRR